MATIPFLGVVLRNPDLRAKTILGLNHPRQKLYIYISVLQSGKSMQFTIPYQEVGTVAFIQLARWYLLTDI